MYIPGTLTFKKLHPRYVPPLQLHNDLQRQCCAWYCRIIIFRTSFIHCNVQSTDTNKRCPQSWFSSSLMRGCFSLLRVRTFIISNVSVYHTNHERLDIAATYTFTGIYALVYLHYVTCCNSWLSWLTWNIYVQ